MTQITQVIQIQQKLNNGKEFVMKILKIKFEKNRL
ncbi:MAG: hypothetical protein ACJASF_001229 [Vicingaceae bacterium]|jgi:hypothetical protein